MSAPDFEIIRFEDWEQFRCNGEVLQENHSLDWLAVLEHLGDAFGFKVDLKYATPELDRRVSESGIVPKSFEEGDLESA